METSEMVKWEYRTIRLEIKETSKGFLGTSYFQDLDDGSKGDISQLGEEDWDMISVSRHRRGHSVSSFVAWPLGPVVDRITQPSTVRDYPRRLC